VGELAALASAATWAATGVVLTRLGAVHSAPILSALRLVAATPLLVVAALAFGALDRLAEAPASAIAAMVVSGIVGYGIGDTLYIRSLPRIGLHRIAPTTTALWVALSVAGGIVLLGEPLGEELLVGGGCIMAGSYVLVAQTASPAAQARRRRWGALPAIAVVSAVAACWATATLLLAGGRADLDATAAGVIRVPMGGMAIAVALIASTRGRALKRLPRGRDLALILSVGVLGTAVGSWLYTFAVGEAGAARTVLLNSTSPIMTLPLSIFVLREPATLRTAVGTVLCLTGTALLLLE
jgi:drug/metabolite transporter (DMT)-like permease